MIKGTLRRPFFVAAWHAGAGRLENLSVITRWVVGVLAMGGVSKSVELLKFFDVFGW